MSAGVKVKLINRRQVKQFALDMAATRAHKFTRVVGDFRVHDRERLHTTGGLRHGTRHDARSAGQNFRPFLYDESNR